MPSGCTAADPSSTGSAYSLSLTPARSQRRSRFRPSFPRYTPYIARHGLHHPFFLFSSLLSVGSAEVLLLPTNSGALERYPWNALSLILISSFADLVTNSCLHPLIAGCPWRKRAELALVFSNSFC